MNVKFINSGSPMALLHQAIEHDAAMLVMAYRTKDGMFRTVASNDAEQGARLLKMGLAAQLLSDITNSEG